MQYLTHQQALKLGHFDSTKRWYPQERAKVPGSFLVKAPSTSFKFTYLFYAKSKAYYVLLKEHNPELLKEVTA
jgi:hypothetical protein